ncbi:sensor domain-containing protein [Streptomyces sp. NPDC050856]|uniref:sensor histidine kinase n=1 Tax=Streptomyces sp. NPDC050856 TaxID=3154939 RepID=UPI0033C2019C
MATAHASAPDSEPDRDTPARRPRLPAVLRAPLEGRTWREFGHLVLSLPLSVFYFVVAVTMMALGTGLVVTFLGIPVLAAGLTVCRGFGAVERARARAALGVRVAGPGPVGGGDRGGLMAWVGGVLKSGASWRHFLYAVLHMPWAVFAFSVAVVLWTCGWSLLTYPLWRWVFPAYAGVGGVQLYGDGTHSIYLDSPFEVTVTSLVGLLFWLVTPWVIRALAGVDRLLVTGLLGPSRLATRVSELESDRGVVVDTAAADLRRIERDLHDGAQARLVALAMDLGLAREKMTEDPQAAARMVDEAHGEVKTALQELRDLARGIHPAILTDRGLDAALSSIASRCTVPVTVTVDLPTRPAPAIEGIAYFTASELLQNISKHSNATHATLNLHHTPHHLILQATDNGHGGAKGTHNSGLTGLTERLNAVDGTLTIRSPTGGPTTITAHIPWRR